MVYALWFGTPNVCGGLCLLVWGGFRDLALVAVGWFVVDVVWVGVDWY